MMQGKMKSKKKMSFMSRWKRDLRINFVLYIMIIPVVLYYILFAYVPMAGIQLAFKDYSPRKSIWGSPWVGFEHFQRFLSGYDFKRLMGNTLTLSIYSLILGTTIPIIFALLINYVRNVYWKKALQMVTYMPYFISSVVIVGMISIFFDDYNGLFNQILNNVGIEKIPFLTSAKLFKHVYAWSGVWQCMGFSAIIYISALAGVDFQIHEAAIVDGASIWKRIWYIDLVEIRSTILVVLIMGLGGVINVGYEKILLMQNALNMSGSDVISTYVYRVGLVNNDYGYSTAVGLFNGVISLILLVISNKASKKIAGFSMW